MCSPRFKIILIFQVFKLGIFKSATENKDFQRYITEKVYTSLLVSHITTTAYLAADGHGLQNYLTT